MRGIGTSLKGNELSISALNYYVSFFSQEMQSQMKALNDKSSLPDMSEMLAGWLGGGASTKSSGSKQNRKR